jgi:hypothetical protein
MDSEKIPNVISCITGTGTAVHTAVILQVLVLILNNSNKMLLLLVLHYCLITDAALTTILLGRHHKTCKHSKQVTIQT